MNLPPPHAGGSGRWPRSPSSVSPPAPPARAPPHSTSTPAPTTAASSPPASVRPRRSGPPDARAAAPRSRAGASASASAPAITTDPVTLTVWDQEVRGGQNEQMKQLNDAFMKKYPNVKINRDSQSFDDLADHPAPGAHRQRGAGRRAGQQRAQHHGRVRAAAGQLLPLNNYADAVRLERPVPAERAAVLDLQRGRQDLRHRQPVRPAAGR